MKKTLVRVLIIALSFIMPLSVILGCANVSIKHTVILKDNNSLIGNPGMGWNFCYYSNQLTKFGAQLDEGDYLDGFPADIVYFRIGWSFIQPDPTFYNVVLKPAGYTIDSTKLNQNYFHWDVIDNVASKWIEAGKRVAIRIVTNDGWGQSAPLWLKDLGAQGVEYDPVTEGSKRQIESGQMTPEQVRNSFTHEGKLWYNSVNNGDIIYDSNGNATGTGAKTWVPKYDDPVYIEYYTKMLESMRDKYDEHLEFVEIGSIGTWGEGHFNRSDPTQQYLTTDAFLAQYDMFYSVFGRDYRVLTNDDIITRGGGEVMRAKSLEYGFGCVDDTLQVDYRDTGKASYTGSPELDHFYLADLPVGIESAPSTTPQEVYLKAVLEHQASYVRLIVDPGQAKSSEYTDQITRVAGYRLNFTEAKMSDLVPGKNFRIDLSLKNIGAAKSLVDGYPGVIIMDENQKVVAKVVSDFNIKSLPVDNYEIDTYKEKSAALKTTQVSLELKIPSKLPDGRYSVNIAVVDGDGSPKFNLPLDDGYNKVYRIATFELK